MTRGCGHRDVYGHGDTAICGQPYWDSDCYLCTACRHKRLLDAARNILILEERFKKEVALPNVECEPFYAELRAAVDELTRKTT